MALNKVDSWLNSRSEIANSIKQKFEVRALPDGRVWACPKKSFREADAHVYSDIQSFIESALKN
jgi:hypothetical protein